MNNIDNKIFEEKARQALEKMWKKKFLEKNINIGSLQKKFDFVSEDENYIGDAKFYKNLKTPAAKFSCIAEYVWLLEKTNAKKKFLIFGNDIDIPMRWLNRFGFITNVEFYFYDMENIKLLNPSYNINKMKLTEINNNKLLELSIWKKKDFEYLNNLNKEFNKWIPKKF